MKILFVCTGNICRSPLAEGILREKMRKHNVSVETDSAGFESFHEGDPPDHRAIITAKKHNIDITAHVARLFTVKDFDDFDMIFVMDEYHYSNVVEMARNEKDLAKVDYIMNIVSPGENIVVPDPWYDGLPEFEMVYQQLDNACDILAGKLLSK